MWERTVDGRELHFRLAGINNQNFIMQDRETGSWWQQVSGEAILGPLKGKKLTRVFHDELSFEEWTAETRGGRVLVPAGDSGKVVPAEWEEHTAHAPVNVHDRADQRLAPRAIILGLTIDGLAKAYPLDRVIAQAPLHDRLAGTALVLFAGPDRKSVRAFRATLDSITLEFVRPAGADSGTLRDVNTGSRWGFSGAATAGPLKGRHLIPIYLLKDYWFDWKTYHPETAVYLLGSRD